MENNNIKTPLVSIRCLVYNHEPFLRECLDGFIMQKTNFAFEAIVHDDASTDRSAAIIREYAEKYPDIIKPIYETENQYSKGDGSLSRIMNAAIHPAVKFIAMCEGDDYWTDPYKLQKQVDIMTNDDKVMLVHSKVKLRADYRVFDDISIKTQQKNTPLALLMANQITTLTVLFRRDIMQKAQELIAQSRIRFPMGDYPLWLAIALHGKIVLLNDCTGVYRVLQESASHSKDRKKKYCFEKGVLDVKLFFYEQYKTCLYIPSAFHNEFQEMIFHSRKRMLLDYGWMAREQLGKLMCTPFKVWKYVVSSKWKRLKK